MHIVDTKLDGLIISVTTDGFLTNVIDLEDKVVSIIKDELAAYQELDKPRNIKLKVEKATLTKEMEGLIVKVKNVNRNCLLERRITREVLNTCIIKVE